jgi:hypothetical protein
MIAAFIFQSPGDLGKQMNSFNICFFYECNTRSLLSLNEHKSRVFGSEVLRKSFRRNSDEEKKQNSGLRGMS